ncbi:MAG: tungsten ABC transporter substrate-binding protein [Desulfobacteraceae bacterium]|nr:MAG: tungsten ABC transporter substrate-binding protein [Desulfobacteraceae bacterium]
MIIGLVLLRGSASAGDQPVLMMATTTSTDDTGLLDYLEPHFKKATGIELRWTATGTGKALALGRNCDVDLLLVHDPEAEIQFVQAGHGVNRHPIMYNDFILIGPPADPAGIKGQSAAGGLAAIAGRRALFVSRGDQSGTHLKELQLWRAATPNQPEKEAWYVQTGQGMLSTIHVAAERSGYTLTDRGTYIKYENTQGGKPPLVVLVEGDERLRNQYSTIEVSTTRCKKVNADAARKFSAWMAGPQARKLIGDFKLLGKQLFIPNAEVR